MFLEVESRRIYYQFNDGSGVPIVLLHGWGGSSKSFCGVYNYLTKLGRSVITLDLPSFGESDLCADSWGIYEYADFVDKFLSALGLSTYNIIGHSFGGRIGIIMAAKHSSAVNKLLLCDSAGIKPKRSLRYYCKIWLYKLKKKFHLNVASSGSNDYQKLSTDMKKVFTRIVNQHLEQELSQISCPTLLIWGEKDKDTPLYMAHKITSLVADSGLVVFPKSGHYSYIDNHLDFCIILSTFFSE